MCHWVVRFVKIGNITYMLEWKAILVYQYLLKLINARVNRRDNQEWTTQRDWQHLIHKTQDKINTRGNRRDNQEWTTHRHWQHRIHKTQDKINTRGNRRDNQEWTTHRQWQHRIHKTQDKINTRVNRRTIKNEQPRDTDNIVYTTHKGQNKH